MIEVKPDQQPKPQPKLIDKLIDRLKAMGRRRLFFVVGVLVFLLAVGAGILYFSQRAQRLSSEMQSFTRRRQEFEQRLKGLTLQVQNLGKENEELRNRLNEVQSEYTKLQETHKAVLEDRDNVLAQAKRLLEGSERLSAVEDIVETITEKNRKLRSELRTKEEQLQGERGIFRKQLEGFRVAQAELIEDRARLEELYARARETLEKKGYISRMKELEEEKRTLAKEKRKLDDALKQAQRRIDDLKRHGSELGKKVIDLTERIEALDEAQSQICSENEALRHELERAPKKFINLARQNKKLIDETSDMHYNLGVFYTENKRFPLAITEFEKVLDLKPGDASTHYNLGVIYSEHLKEHKKAIRYFRRFLELAPHTADAGWVKRYIVTWETYYGEEFGERPFER